jgi:hypothetical protein
LREKNPLASNSSPIRPGFFRVRGFDGAAVSMARVISDFTLDYFLRPGFSVGVSAVF